MTENWFEVLAAHRASTVDEINGLRKVLARHLHPDRAGGDAYAMARVNAAHAALTDPAARKTYLADAQTGRKQCATCKGEGYKEVAGKKLTTLRVICPVCKGLGLVPK